MNASSFPQLAPFGIAITTYEIDPQTQRYIPVLTHIFWGQNFNEAIGYARSHLITDVFYSSSFIGELPWKSSVLLLTNEGRYIGIANAPNINETVNDLAQKAKIAHQAQVDTRILQTVHMLSST